MDTATGVVFDGDDTLWLTEPLYDEARSEAASAVADAGLSAEDWERRERVIDVRNVATMGFSTARFPASCVQAYEELCRESGRSANASVAARIREAAHSVFARDPPPAPGARDTLGAFRERGYKLALLTKGDPQIQAHRIEQSGLRDLFHVVDVVREKSPAGIRRLVSSMGVDAPNAWMVGNSLRSDILPALEAGLKAVWLRTHVWEYERAHDHLADERVRSISELSELRAMIAP
jgi:putative hydrolase of the HAD superfamily